MKPIVMQPVYRHYLWGGEKLRAWGKDADASPLAESWEVSCRADGMSRDRASARTLEEIWQESHKEEFPLLIKWIDAARDLSVQVHPDDAAAQAMGQPFGKTECWYVLEAEPGARLALGLEQDTDAQTLRRAAQDGTLAEYLHWVEPEVGACYFIPAGMIHALGAGIMVAEVQQNSDTTYRLYDYGRLDADGSPRPLHLEQALEVADLAKSRVQASRAQGEGWSILCETRDFCLEKGNTPRLLGDEEDFSILMALDEVKVGYEGGSLSLSRGETAFVPAGVRAVAVEPQGDVLYITRGGRNA